MLGRNAAAAFAFLLMTLSSLASAQSSTTSSSGKRFGIIPYRPNGSGTLAIPAVAPACKSPSLTYFGGPIVSNVQVVPVLWGPQVNATTKANIAQFFSDAVVSNWYDMLSEYASIGGTHQSIGRGTSMSAVTITPSLCGGTTNCTVSDADLQSELTAQILAGNLPALQFDGSGNVNSAYMMFFPPNVKVTGPSGSGTSCVNFCAYHNTGLFNPSTPLPYGVVMDTYTTACAMGCGTDPDPFNNLSSGASHELSELVTDTDIGLDFQSSYAAPAAWADSNSQCGEIADICDTNSAESTITVSGRTWTVQQLWSNRLNQCVGVGLHPSLSFTAAATAQLGSAITLQLNAINPDAASSQDTAYAGTVHFTSSDAGALLPEDFTYLPGDAGTHSFSVTFNSPGTQTVTATDTLNSLVTGVSSGVEVDLTTLTTTCPKAFVQNQSTLVTASVAGSSPTGTVTFTDSSGTLCANVPLSSGKASCQTPGLIASGSGPSAPDLITAYYSGDGSNGPSASSPLIITLLQSNEPIFFGGFDIGAPGCPPE